MADRYIDYWEVSEYGRHFLDEAQELVGATPLVDMEQVRQRVLAEIEAVEAELGTTGTQRSGLRVGRGSIAEAVEAARDVCRRFYRHLQTVPADAGLDLAAFFPGEKLGDLLRLKPADLLARASEVLRGFDAPVNAALPGREVWQPELQTARDALAAAVAGKREAGRGARVAGAALTEARLRFLHAYNKLAKGAVRLALADLGRDVDFKKFFLDTQVNENGSAGSGSDEEPDDGSGDEPGEAPDELPGEPDDGAPSSAAPAA